MMQITRRSQFSGIVRTLDLEVTPEQMHNYAQGMLLQDAFPQLPRDQREFIKTGIVQEEWDAMFAEDDTPDMSDQAVMDEEGRRNAS